MEINTKRRRKANLAVAALAAVQILVLLLFGGQKKGYFIDEIYSWGLANSYYKPFVASYDVFDRWVTEDVAADYMTVQKGERFAYQSVYYNQAQDVHPPFFIWRCTPSVRLRLRSTANGRG